MRIACPSCSTQYDVPDHAITPTGRLVRCSNCGHEWRALPEDEAPAPTAIQDPGPDPDDAPETAVDSPDFSALFQEATTDEALTEPAPSPAPLSDDVVDPGTGPTPETSTPAPDRDDDPDSPFASLRSAVERSGSVDLTAERAAEAERAQEAALAADHDDSEPLPTPLTADPDNRPAPDAAAAERGRKRRQLGWISLGVFWIALIGGLFAFRGPITELWPAAQGLYRPLGLVPVAAEIGAAAARNPADILRRSTPEVGYVDATDPNRGLTLTVTISNPSDRAVAVPGMTGQALDGDGAVIFQWPVDPPAKRLDAGGSMAVETRIDLYPAGAESLRVVFDGQTAP